MAGCHFTKEEVVKLQKGLRFRFLESQNLERESFFFKYFVFVHLNLVDVMEVAYLVS